MLSPKLDNPARDARTSGLLLSTSVFILSLWLHLLLATSFYLSIVIVLHSTPQLVRETSVLVVGYFLCQWSTVFISCYYTYIYTIDFIK